MKEIRNYIKELEKQYATNNATEHSHRLALQELLKTKFSNMLITNEPKRTKCGAPDFVLTRDNIPIGHIEAKDIGKDLDSRVYTEQLERYVESLDNLIFTNYTEFRLFRDGKQKVSVSIAETSDKHIKPKPENFNAFADILKEFAGYQGVTITNADDLAQHMARKARLLATEISGALEQDETESGKYSKENSQLLNELAAFRKYLVHDIESADFADIYAQTVAYGMFAARLHDHAENTSFNCTKAAELIPTSNPFLRNFFQHIAGYNLDNRIRWIVEALADVFRATDVSELMENYGKTTQRSDPFLHFYETFLGKYDQNLRKKKGVYYTPEPVVNFIVRAVDEILRIDFALDKGIADIQKTTIEVNEESKSKPPQKEVHKVQILDPATGTGTFLATIVQHIYETEFASQKGTWPDYVKKHLIPRLNGFEVLMAPYAMAHTKLEMVLCEKGCEFDDERLRIFLTNSLEEHHHGTGTLFAQWLSEESNEANTIKRETPVMVVLGNPPYKGESANKGQWITDLLQDYKQEPGGGPLNEKNLKWLNDDYVKFIRYGQHCIDKTGEGVLAYINNNGFLDNPTFRGMRWNLLQSFDKIYILDLHGNSKKKETAPDGSPDKNVFDIQQGVSINLFIKTGEKKKGALAHVLHRDLYGERESKYQFLREHDLKQTDFQKLEPQAPHYLFVPKDYELQAEYDRGFSIADLFVNNGTGIVTKRDKLSIHFSKNKAKQAARDILDMDRSDFYKKYDLPADVRDWKYERAKDDISQFGITDDLVRPINYRPFDVRNIVYTGRTRGFIGWPVTKIMCHFLRGENIGLIFKRGGIEEKAAPVFLTKFISDARSWSRPGMRGVESSAPLYHYPDDKQQTLDEKEQREPNLDQNLIQTIAAGLGLRFTPEKEDDEKTFAPIDLLDYIYAVLHSPAYRERYKEPLKIDFPRVPYPTDKKQFRKLAELGSQLRALHLLESPLLDKLITDYPVSGEHVVSKPDRKFEITDSKNRLGKVHINKTQYFDKVPETAWNFYIGGYQPAQKWLKDRIGRTLNHDDISHYQKIILALTETARLMKEIDQVPILQKAP